MTDPTHLPQPPLTTLTTPRLQLRTVTMSDLDAVLPFITDAETMKYTSGVVPKGNRAVAEKWLSARCLGREVFNFVIVRRKEDEGEGDRKEEVVGMMGSYAWPEIGYLIAGDHQGKGYATEALQAFVPAFFNRMAEYKKTNNQLFPNLNYIKAETDAANTGSQRVLLKSGFKLFENLPASFESPHLGVRDTLVFRVWREGCEPACGGEEEGRWVPDLQ